LAKEEIAQCDKQAALTDLEKAMAAGVKGWGKDSESLIPIYKEYARVQYSDRRFARAETAAKEALLPHMRF